MLSVLSDVGVGIDVVPGDTAGVGGLEGTECQGQGVAEIQAGLTAESHR